MSSGFVPGKVRYSVFGVFTGITLLILLFWLGRGELWSRWDYWLSDTLYRVLLVDKQRIPLSERLLFVVFNDDSLDAFSAPFVDRQHLSRVTQAIAELQPDALVFNFVLAEDPHETLSPGLADSIKLLSAVYFPVGLELSNLPGILMARQLHLFETLQPSLLPDAQDADTPTPLHSNRILPQARFFMEQASGLGHINTSSDPDGVYRHLPSLIRVNDALLPSLPLSIFLSLENIDREKIQVQWGRSIRIPMESYADGSTHLDIPIDELGRMFVPATPFWDSGFEKLAAHQLLEYMESDDIRGNLEDLFAGKIVWLADLSSSGGSDLGPSSVEVDSPLLNLHVSMLNALLTKTFFQYTPTWLNALIMGLGGLLLLLGGLSGHHGMLHWAGIMLFAALALLAAGSTLQHLLLPMFSIAISLGMLFLALEITRRLALLREKLYLQNAFSFYLPAPVLGELMRKPEFLRLGGQEKTVTIVFSDLANFTTLSETMPPQALVSLLNRYMSAMTEIVQDHGGIVDKYLGDGLMAEFGIPLDLPDHANQAVLAGLGMIQRLEQLNQKVFKHLEQPLVCRIGIHTGKVVVGNMGAENTFDYTVIGDAVNLASRIETENKRFKTHLLVSESTYRSLTPGRFIARPMDTVVVKGKTQPVNLFEIAAEHTDSLSIQRNKFCREYFNAYKAYQAGDLQAARCGFEKALELQEDVAARIWLARIESSVTHPPNSGGLEESPKRG